MVVGTTLLIASGLYFLCIGMAGLISDQVSKNLRK